MDYREDLSVLVDLTVNLVDNTAKSSFAFGLGPLTDAQVLSLKHLRHLISVKSLSEGCTLERNGEVLTAYIDFSSAQILARAVVENYLTLHHVFAHSDPTERLIRQDMWMLAGLIDRQKIAATTEDGKKSSEQNRQQLAALRSEIQERDYYENLNPKLQKRYLEGKWRGFLHWHQLGEKAGFDPLWIKNTYTYLCEHSHSSYISALQVCQAEDLDIQNELASAALLVCVLITAHFVRTYVGIFPQSLPVLLADEKGMEVVDYWFTDLNASAKVFRPL